MLKSILSSVVLTLTLLSTPISAQSSSAPDDQPGKNKPDTRLPIEEVTAFSKAYSYIKQLYIDEVTDQQLLDGAIRGMLESLDPHSNYLDQHAMEAIQQSTTGSYGGLGIEVDSAGALVTIIAPLDGSPAEKAGIKAGDKIIKLNNKSVVGISTSKVVDMLKGDIGTAITITVRRDNSEKPLSFNVTRDIIKLTSVRSKWLTESIAYVRISQFSSDTFYDVKHALAKIVNHPRKQLDGLILDLRNNPGGLLDSAIAISDEFLESGLIVSTKGRAYADEQYYASPGDVLNGKPIIVLVNNGSASAAEIVAGALQDHKRGLLLGDKTFGKGSVQTIKHLSAHTALKLTISRYYSPLGHAIQNNGLTPDIQVPKVKLENLSGDKLVREQNLLNNLTDDGTQQSNTAVLDQNLLQLLQDDYQLYQAVTVLQGIHTFARY